MTATCEELGRSLVECLKDVSDLLERAHTIALREQDALVKSDAEAITLTCRSQEEILRRISEADQRAAAITGELAQNAGVDLDEARIEIIAETAGFPYSDLIIGETQHISEIAEKVHEANEINSHLLRNGMEIIACCLKTLASDTRPNNYTRTASVAQSQPYVLSLDIRA